MCQVYLVTEQNTSTFSNDIHRVFRRILNIYIYKKKKVSPFYYTAVAHSSSTLKIHMKHTGFYLLSFLKALSHTV